MKKEKLKEFVFSLSPFVTIYALLGVICYYFMDSAKSDWFGIGEFWLTFQRLEDFPPFDVAQSVRISLGVWELYFLVGIFFVSCIVLSKFLEIHLRGRTRRKNNGFV